MRPLAIDLFCGLGGWTEGLLAEGYEVVGFDVERHRYPARAVPEKGGGSKGGGTNWHLARGGVKPEGFKANQFAHANEREWLDAPLTGGWVEYPAQLVIQDVLTLHGSQFADAALIVASPPCQEFSYMAMPWSRAKAIAKDYETGVRDRRQLTALFDACFRIQREASEAAGRHVPLVVENVRGACRWVGRSRWNYGSFHLWGDVPALMPMARKMAKASGHSMEPGEPKWNMHHTECVAAALMSQSVEASGVKNGNDWFGSGDECSLQRRAGSKSPARKAASALIARIPFSLSSHIAKVYYPT